MKRIRRGRRAARRRGGWAGAAALACALVALLVLVEGFHAFTWRELFAFAGLRQEQIEPPKTEDEPAAGAVAPAETEPLEQGQLRLTVLDVGQADSILIETDGFAALIDAGDYFSEKAVVGALQARGIERLDLLVATHPHRDHIGGILGVIENFEIGRVLFTNHSDELTPTNAAYMELLNKLIVSPFPTATAGTGEVIEIPRGSLTVLSAGGYNDLNDCSLVIRCVYGQTSFLLTGDAGFQTENAMMADGLPLDCDVLKAGHHGSQYSTSQAFLEAVSPDYIAVSCGADNPYDFPSGEFLERASAAGVSVLRTDLDGDIVFLSDGETVRVVTNGREAA